MSQETETTASGIDRRSVLKKAAAAGAIVWTAPTLLEHSAHATSLGGSPKCRPKLTVACATYDCQQGGKVFPGIKISCSSICPCDSTKTFSLCAKVSGLPSDILAYAPPTTCAPSSPPDVIVSTGTFKCTPCNGTIFFGRTRGGNGAIPELGNSGTNNTLNFQLCLFAGFCPGKSGGPQASVCQSYTVSFEWANGSNTFISCNITANNNACGCENLASPPCTCP